jgi:hypothetical protein
MFLSVKTKYLDKNTRMLKNIYKKKRKNKQRKKNQRNKNREIKK